MEGLRKSIENAINRNSAENGSNTPDFILAQYLLACLKAFDEGVNRREEWYGRTAAPFVDPGATPPGAMLGECVGHLGPPSNTATPHPKGPTCSYWRALAPDTAKEGRDP